MVLPELVRLTPVFQAGCPVQYQGDAEPIARLEIDSTKPSSSSINSTGKSLVQNFQAVKSLETKQDPPNQSQVERRKVLYPRTPRSVEVSLVEGHSKKKLEAALQHPPSAIFFFTRPHVGLTPGLQCMLSYNSTLSYNTEARNCIQFILR